MKSVTDKVKVLDAEIRLASNGFSREGGLSLQEGDVIDSYGDESEMEIARLSVTDAWWEDVTDDVLEKYCDGLVYLPAESFCYYLPAIMCYWLRRWNESNSLITEMMVYQISPRPYKDRCRLLTREQGHAVRNFLLFLVEQDECADQAKDALQQYWNQYEC